MVASARMSIASPQPRLTGVRPVFREIPARPVEESIARAQAALLNLQHADGYWVGELQGDSILESEYLLMKLILGQENDADLPGKVGRTTLLRIANHLRLVQREDGTWGQYPGSPPDVSACVKA